MKKDDNEALGELLDTSGSEIEESDDEEKSEDDSEKNRKKKEQDKEEQLKISSTPPDSPDMFAPTDDEEGMLKFILINFTLFVLLKINNSFKASS